MYEINLLKDSQYKDSWYFKTKNEFNQTLFLELYVLEGSVFKKNKTYYTTFRIQTKKKLNYQFLKSTGKDGLKSLIWAKKCIQHFMNEILLSGDKIIIIIADDNKRFKAYQYGLKKIKFDTFIIDNKKCLIYKKV